MTPRGTQDKQPLAPTWRESPWTSADYKTRRNNIERSVLYEDSMKSHLQSVTRKLLYEYNKQVIRLAYRPLRLPTLLHLTVGYRYALEYRTPLCSTSSNRKASSRPGSHRDSSALTPYLWINTELCTQPWRSRQKTCDGPRINHTQPTSRRPLRTLRDETFHYGHLLFATSLPGGD